MTERCIFLDESGDLGWKFDLPYRNGGSSRYLTIASLVASPEKRSLSKRAVKKLYKQFKWPFEQEKKWSGMNAAERLYFAESARKLFLENDGEIKFLSITVRKERVQNHIRQDANKLYNYMIGLSLLDEMSAHDRVSFVPDPRSVKVESGNSLHDYLQTKLWCELNSSCVINTQPCDSCKSQNVQFADMLSGLVQSHFEDGNSGPWNILRSHITSKRLYF
jgi:hypothetical protein